MEQTESNVSSVTQQHKAELSANFNDSNLTKNDRQILADSIGTKCRKLTGGGTTKAKARGEGAQTGGGAGARTGLAGGGPGGQTGTLASKVQSACKKLTTMKSQCLDLTHNLKSLAKGLNGGKASNKYQTTTMGLEQLMAKAKDMCESIEKSYAGCEPSLSDDRKEVHTLQEEMVIRKSAAKEALRIGASTMKANKSDVAQ